MFPTTIALTALLAAGFIAAALPKVLALPRSAADATHLGYSTTAFRIIGLLELAGATAVIAGLFWALLGVIAAGGLVCVSAGALASHLRVKDNLKTAVPAVLCGVLAAAVLLLRLATI